MSIGIYGITNMINNKIYIGQSSNIQQRFIRHRWELNHNRHSNIYLQEDWNQYGKDNFIFTILEICSPDILIERETYWISCYGGINGNVVYNMLSITDGHIQATRERIHNTLHTRYQNIPHHSKGRIVSIEGRERMSVSHKGRKHSDETKEKIKQGNLGKHLSDETKEKMRQSKIGKPSPRKGVHLSEEHKAKLRAINLGKKLSNETRNKISERNRDRSGRYIMQMSINGTYIAVYDSLKKAALAVGGNPTCICEVCRGTQRTSKGFIWKYITKEEFDALYLTKE